MPEVIFEKSDGKFTRVKVVLEDNYYTLYVNGEEISSCYEDEPDARQSMIEEAEAHF